MALADLGWREALRANQSLAHGLNTHDGAVTYAPVAEAHGMESTDLAAVLASA